MKKVRIEIIAKITNMEKKKKTKSLPKLKKELQIVFNAYIRKRDEGKVCISCGQYKDNMQAGHYYSVRMYDSLRFDEDNVHNECSGCNCFNDSHLIGYGDNLINRIGIERVNALKKRAADYKKNGYKWSRTELLEKLDEFKLKIKEL